MPVHGVPAGDPEKREGDLLKNESPTVGMLWVNLFALTTVSNALALLQLIGTYSFGKVNVIKRDEVG